jgi:hypothetical protein
MIYKKISPRYIWIIFYIAINIISLSHILNYNSLVGETSGVSIIDTTPIIAIGILVLSSYLFILGPVFNSFYKLPANWLPRTFSTAESGRDLGIILLFLQLGFIVLIISDGSFIAGSTLRSGSLWSQFFVLFPVDTIFFLYYGFYRKNKMFMPNMVLTIISNLLRGWIGIISTLVILESMRLMRNKKLSISKIIFYIVGISFIFPLIQSIKLVLRASATDLNIKYSDLIIEIFDLDKLTDLFSNSFNIISDRLQIISHNIVSFQSSDLLNYIYESDQILPFWLEGIHGVAFYRLIGSELPDNIGIQFGKLLDPSNVDVNWNVNPGLFVWWFMDPFLGILYSIYILFILYMTISLVKSIHANTPETSDVIWFSWLAFLMPGWTGSIYLFFHATLLFYLCHFIGGIFINKPSLKTRLNSRSA